MIFRLLHRLVGLVAILGLGWLIARLIGDQKRRPRPRPDPRKLRVEGKMVRDRVCNTFLPQSRAIVERVGGDELYFCSETCRRTFRDRACGKTAAGADGA